jgi:hypothetical protein
MSDYLTAAEILAIHADQIARYEHLATWLRGHTAAR